MKFTFNTIELTTVLVSQVVLASIGLLVLKCTTSVFPPGTIRDMALAMSISGFVVQVISKPRIQGISRFVVPARNKNELHKYAWSGDLQVLELQKTLLYLFLFVTSLLFFADQYKNYWFLYIGILIGIFTSGINYYTATLNAGRHRISVMSLSLTEFFLRVSPALILVVLVLSLKNYLILLLVFSAFQLLISRHFYRTVFSVAQDDEGVYSSYRNRITGFERPLYLAALPFWFFQLSDRWLVTWFSDETSAATYIVLMQVGFMPLTLLFGFVRKFSLPIQIDAFERKAGEVLRRSSVRFFSAFLPFSISILIGCFYYGDVIVSFLSNSFYADNASGLPWFAASAIFFCVGQWFVLLMEVSKKTVWIFRARALSAVFLVGSFLGVGIYAPSNFPLSLLAANVFYALLSGICLYLSEVETK